MLFCLRQESHDVEDNEFDVGGKMQSGPTKHFDFMPFSLLTRDKDDISSKRNKKDDDDDINDD